MIQKHDFKIVRSLVGPRRNSWQGRAVPVPHNNPSPLGD